MNKILFIGNIQFGESPTGGGAQARNQIFLRHLQEKFSEVSYFDTWKKNRFISLMIILIKILNAPNEKIILSLSFKGVYILSKILCFLGLKRNIYYWVIGGDIVDCINKVGNGSYKYLSYYKYIIVQAEYMANDLKKLGFVNVKVVSNFKNIPDFELDKKTNSKLKFVFLARLIEEKGVGLIIESAKKIGTKGYEIDFFGPLSDTYNQVFFDNLGIDNIRYKGFLDLNTESGYLTLSTYDVMLFPTYFPGEGFPGVLIDAFIAGLPVVSTDFHANPEVITNGVNGIIVEVNNLRDLENTMVQFIKGVYPLNVMKVEAKKSAKFFKVENVLNDKLFLDLGIN